MEILIFLKWILLLTWPWFFGTWLAVAVFHAANPSTARTATGAIFEGVWLIAIVVGAFIEVRRSRAKSAYARPAGPTDPAKP